MPTGSDISWTAARDAAAARPFFGLQGYLTTVTSAAESAFVSSKLQSFSWLGASDAAVEGDWRWVTGPEAGTRFYTGVSPSGFAVPGSYTHWNPGEPNNGGGNQHYAISLDSANDGLWNDCPDLSCSITSYAVEYGGMVGDPVIQVSDDATVLLDPAGDPDSDGLPTSIEATYGTNPASTTSPVANPTADDDSDGVTNAWEAILQTDPTDADSNSGRTAATNEAANGTSDANEDFDGDSIPNLIEIRNGTDPLNPASPVAVNPTADPDSDGVTNAWERILGTDPANPDSDSTKTAPNEAGNGKNDGAEDFDGDGIPNRLEIIYGTDPLDATSPVANPTADGDNDGLSNAWEAILGSDPAVADSNSTKTTPNEADNGIGDAAEDFDSDGIPNRIEIRNGTDPLDATSPVANPTADGDNDGLSNAWEAILGSDPAVADSNSTKTTPNEADNGIGDAAEDFDSDGIPNRIEIRNGTDPLDATSPVANPTADGDNDGLSNAWEAILGSDPAVADSNSTKTVANEAGNGKNDGAEDFDGDGTTNAKEIADGTDPLNASDPLKTDLEVTQTASTVNLSQLTLAITVRNKGPNPVTGAVLSDTFPTSIAGKVWTWTCVGTACPAASGTGNLSATNATLGALAVNETAVFTVTGEIADWSHWSNTASVLMPSGITDGVNTNDSLTAGRYQILMPLVIR